jgi:hypothetical protein
LAHADVWGRKPIFLCDRRSAARLPYPLADNPFWLVEVQLLTASALASSARYSP